MQTHQLPTIYNIHRRRIVKLTEISSEIISLAFYRVACIDQYQPHTNKIQQTPSRFGQVAAFYVAVNTIWLAVENWVFCCCCCLDSLSDKLINKIFGT